MTLDADLSADDDTLVLDEQRRSIEATPEVIAALTSAADAR